jgi:hypothetical protein
VLLRTDKSRVFVANQPGTYDRQSHRLHFGAQPAKRKSLPK